MTLGAAIGAYLDTLNHPESKGTHRAYGTAYRVLMDAIGQATDLNDVNRERLSAAFRGCWGNAKPSTWNARRGAVGSLLAYCEAQGWIPDAGAIMAGIETRKVAPDRTRALTRAELTALLKRPDLPLRDKSLFTMLYETAARSAEILALNVEDLDRPNKRARVIRKGGAQDWIVWQTGTATLLPRLLKGRTSGPLFVTDRKARVQLPPSDLDEHGRARLSYRQAEDLFRQASDGATLHQLRHSALTHAAEDGWSTVELMARSGHSSVRSLARYARVSPEALQRKMEATDPARRR
jgi:integrase/recombinase XerC/integrase/recombinase XerD